MKISIVFTKTGTGKISAKLTASDLDRGLTGLFRTNKFPSSPGYDLKTAPNLSATWIREDRAEISKLLHREIQALRSHIQNIPASEVPDPLIVDL